MKKQSEKYSEHFDESLIVFDVKKDKFPDPRNWQYSDLTVGALTLPTSVDLRKDFMPCVNQLSLNSCQSFAVMSVIEYLWRTRRKEVMNFSELYTYYKIREGYGKQKYNVGAYIIDSIKSPIKNGFVREQTWPYIVNKFADSPSLLSGIETQFWKLYLPKGYAQIKTLTEIKNALANKQPVIFGMSIRDSFMQNTAIKTNTGNSRGGHAMIIVGFNDSENHFIVRNSWGNRWGDNGYCYIDYKYLVDMFDLYVYL